MALQDQLGKMIGPLPMGAWLAVIAGGLGFALYYRNQNAAATADTSVPMDNTTTDSGTSIPSGYGYVGDGTTDGSSTTTAPTITDDDAWVTAALTQMTAKGYDPLATSAALSKYMAGEKLNTQEAALVRVAIQLVGSPPSVPTTPTPAPPVTTHTATWVGSATGPGPVNAWYQTKSAVHAYDSHGKALTISRPKGYDIIVYQWGKIGSTFYAKSLNYYYPASALAVKAAPKPRATAPKPPAKKAAPRPTVHQQPKAPAKPKVRTYKVQKGDTLTSIAQHFHLKSWHSIANANKNKIKNPNRIDAGWTLIIPNS